MRPRVAVASPEPLPRPLAFQPLVPAVEDDPIYPQVQPQNARAHGISIGALSTGLLREPVMNRTPSHRLEFWPCLRNTALRSASASAGPCPVLRRSMTR